MRIRLRGLIYAALFVAGPLFALAQTTTTQSKEKPKTPPPPPPKSGPISPDKGGAGKATKTTTTTKTAAKTTSKKASRVNTEITAVDIPAKTVTTADGKVYKFSDESKISLSGKYLTPVDLEVGDSVSIAYTDHEGERLIKYLSVRKAKKK